MPDKNLMKKKDCNYLLLFIITNIFKPVNKKTDKVKYQVFINKG